MSYNNNYTSEISRILPAEISSAAGYGQYETSNALSSISSSAIDQRLLEHENPNRCNTADLAPALPLEQYRLNVDQNPHIIRRKPNEKVQYTQEIAVRYLKPPPPPRGGDIVIRQLPTRQHAPAPPLIVRQPGPQAPTPPPLVIREAPPQPPQPLPGKQITIPGKVIPPPARKVIVERLPPTPAKPQQVFIERWLPYGQQSQRVVFQPARASCVIPDPKNVVIQWESPDVEIRREFKNLGIQQADPQDYISRYGAQLVRADALPEIALKYSNQQGVQLAANSRNEQNLVIEGDVQALRLIDLEANGLGYLRGRISGSLSDLRGYSSAEAIGAAASSSYASAAYATTNSYGGSYEAESIADNVITY